MGYENHVRKVNANCYLRFYEYQGRVTEYKVQLIDYPGAKDRRRKIREKRTMLFTSKNRAEAVAFFTDYLTRQQIAEAAAAEYASQTIQHGRPARAL